MRHPLEAVSPDQRMRFFKLLLFLTLAYTAWLTLLGLPLRTEAAPLGVLSFELAGDVETARAILDSWGDAGRRIAVVSTSLDYIYLVVYSTAIGFVCIWSGAVLRGRGSRLAAAGGPLAWAQWLGGGLDAVENTALLLLLVGPVVEPWPRVAWGCAVVKFLLVFLGLGYGALGAIAGRRGPRGGKG